MRIQRLDLLAFGPFTDVHLDLAGPSQGGLHVVHGRNEAGKSTALRALRGLLYGIPHLTPDAHVHPQKTLRIGARLQAASGETLDVVRRKGRKGTLLDAEERVLDEAVLLRMLANVPEERFCALFALDHETLRSGAMALLAGRGDVGESLFDAGGGGRSIHAVLAALESEAEAIWTPQARKRSLNEAITSFEKARRACRDAALSATAWKDQEDAIERACETRDRLRARRDELAAERSRLERALRVLPLLATLDDVRVQRAALGDVPALPEDCAARRSEAEVSQERCLRDGERIARELASLDARLAELPEESELLLLSDEAVDDLRNRLGGQRTASLHLPKRRAERDTARQEVSAALRALKRPDVLEDVDALRLDAASAARIRALANARGEVVAELRHARTRSEELEARARRLERELVESSGPDDGGELRAAFEAARALGDLDARLVDRRVQYDVLRDELDARLAGLAPRPAGTAREVRRLAVPDVAATESAARRDEAFAKEDEALHARRRDLDERRRGLEARVRDVERDGPVPSAEVLREAREARDARWRGLRAGESPLEGPEGDRFEDDLRATDELADVLGAQAKRVARLAHLQAELAGCDVEDRALGTAVGDLEARRTRHEAAWRATWEACGCVPATPAAGLAWLSAHAEIVRKVDELLRLEAQLAQDTTRHEAARDTLSRALVRAHDASVSEADAASRGAMSLGRLVAAAEDVLAQRVASERSRARTLDEQRANADERAAAADVLARAEAETASWTARWGRSMDAISLAHDALPGEATAVLDGIQTLFARLDALEALQRRVTGMEDDAAQFASDVERLVTRHAPDLSGRPADEQADELARRHQLARESERRRAALLEERATKESEREALEHERHAAQQTLDELLRKADVSDLDALRTVERRADEVARLDERAAELDLQLVQAGEGVPLDALRREVADLSVDHVRARLPDVEDELTELNDDLDVAIRHLAGAESGLEHQRRDTRAADEAESAQGLLARVRHEARRYLRARLAATLLRHEVERYREENQGPILRRAAELFPRLTLGRYARLRAGNDADGRAVLVCVRADGSEVEVDGLSDGTRDQLFLALRVASLERHLEHDEPLPLVLDDVLVHFDDERAQAALSVLGDLARRQQVLFFTHHERLVELARAAAPDVLRVHDLDDARRESVERAIGG